MFNSRLAILVAAATLTCSAFAADEPPGFTINPGIGMTEFDSSTQLDEDSHWSLGFGYRFDNPWALELNYASVDTNSKPTGLGVDVDYLTLGGLYHLPSQSSWKPFLSLGLGERGIDASGASSEDSVVELGAGLKYLLSAK
ncbi:MAG: porin family protein, partial [Gammaproteobacteria bacterium]|nr:porin family protein [Gammaproteobacteria bacterium]